MGLQRGDLARDHRAGQAQLLRHGRKAAAFRNPHEETHGIESIHCCIPRNKQFLIVTYFAAMYSSTVRAMNSNPGLPNQAPQPSLFVPHGAPTFALRPGAAGAALVRVAASSAAPAGHRRGQPALGHGDAHRRLRRPPGDHPRLRGLPARAVCHPLSGHRLQGSAPPRCWHACVTPASPPSATRRAASITAPGFPCG